MANRALAGSGGPVGGGGVGGGGEQDESGGDPARYVEVTPQALKMPHTKAVSMAVLLGLNSSLHKAHLFTENFDKELLESALLPKQRNLPLRKQPRGK